MLNRRELVLGSAGAAAAAILPQTLSAASEKSATDDIALLGDILRNLHPGLYRYQSPSAMERSLEQLALAWTAHADLATRYLNLSRFLATIKCGHSYANFFNQKKTVQTELFDHQTRVPFTFRWLGNQMVVLQDQSGTASLPPGSIIRAINDVAATDILSRLLPYARADGNNDEKRRALLSATGGDEIETFDVFQGLLALQNDASGCKATTRTFHLRVRLPEAKRDAFVNLPALTLLQRQSFMRGPDYRGDDAAWQWTMRSDGIAVLRMDGWALYNSKWDWAAWLNERLDSLSGAKGLIVDIRENEGGLDCGDLILARLAGRDIAKPKYNRLVRYVKTPEALNPHLDTWDNSFRDWSSQISSKEGRFYRLKPNSEGSTVAAAARKLAVPMTVLTSAQNSSATFQFAALTKQLGLGTLVGDTTGGNQRGINGGAFFFARLPQSGIEFDVPLIGFFPDTRKPDAGITPDITVAMTADAIASGADPQMQAAVRHLLRA